MHYDVRAHPFERLIHVRMRNRGPSLRFAIELADDGDEPRGGRLSPCAARAEGTRAKALAGWRAPLLVASLEHPCRRSVRAGGLETPPLSDESAKIRFRRRPAKGDAFRRTKVLSTDPEPPRVRSFPR